MSGTQKVLAATLFDCIAHLDNIKRAQSVSLQTTHQLYRLQYI